MATPRKRTNKTPPKVRARKRGRTGQLMTMIEDKVKEAHPDVELRWVYEPPHEEQHSQVWRREIDGYSVVDPEVEGLDLPHGKIGNRIKVGDLVLLMIDKEARAELDKENKERAELEASKSREAYYDSMRSLRAGEHRGRPTGDIKEKTTTVSTELPSKE